MRVRLTFGRKAGEVIDLPVPSARAMLADGRAVAEDATVSTRVVGAIAPPSAVALREDRTLSKAKRRATR